MTALNQTLESPQDAVDLSLGAASGSASVVAGKLAEGLAPSWHEAAALLHDYQRLLDAISDALMQLDTNFDIDGNSMEHSDAARALRSVMQNRAVLFLTHNKTMKNIDQRQKRGQYALTTRDLLNE